MSSRRRATGRGFTFRGELRATSQAQSQLALGYTKMQKLHIEKCVETLKRSYSRERRYREGVVDTLIWRLSVSTDSLGGTGDCQVFDIRRIFFTCTIGCLLMEICISRLKFFIQFYIRQMD